MAHSIASCIWRMQAHRPNELINDLIPIVSRQGCKAEDVQALLTIPGAEVVVHLYDSCALTALGIALVYCNTDIARLLFNYAR